MGHCSGWLSAPDKEIIGKPLKYEDIVYSKPSKTDKRIFAYMVTYNKYPNDTGYFCNKHVLINPVYIEEQNLATGRWVSKDSFKYKAEEWVSWTELMVLYNSGDYQFTLKNLYHKEEKKL